MRKFFFCKILAAKWNWWQRAICNINICQSLQFLGRNSSRNNLSYVVINSTYTVSPKKWHRMRSLVNSILTFISEKFCVEICRAHDHLMTHTINSSISAKTYFADCLFIFFYWWRNFLLSLNTFIHDHIVSEWVSVLVVYAMYVIYANPVLIHERNVKLWKDLKLMNFISTAKEFSISSFIARKHISISSFIRSFIL